MSVVRWFVLADGLTYGSGPLAPRFREYASPQDSWSFDPPAIDGPLLHHFAHLLERFQAVSDRAGKTIQLLPVFIDFKFCEPGLWPCATLAGSDGNCAPDTGWVKGGRAAVVQDSAAADAFLANALEPLLALSNRHRDVIYAWEIINEPEWVTNGWEPSGREGLPVNAAAMADFIRMAKQRIESAGFRTTVGFNRLETIFQSGLFCDVNQFHHYPGGRRSLANNDFADRGEWVVGEFSTNTEEDQWPELAAPELGFDGQSVLRRLTHAAEMGYALALPWSFRAQDRHSDWPRAEADLAEFHRLGRQDDRPAFSNLGKTER